MVDRGRGIDIPNNTFTDDHMTSSRPCDVAIVSYAEGKIYFNVRFERKEAARAAGLRWDPAVRKWYAPNTEIAESFLASAHGEVLEQTVHERFYFNVPFMQKTVQKPWACGSTAHKNVGLLKAKYSPPSCPGSFPPIVGNLTQSQAPPVWWPSSERLSPYLSNPF
jgi:hypothetical protein